jgi:IclR family transcriptional regulator, acetate operon repressor
MALRRPGRRTMKSALLRGLEILGVLATADQPMSLGAVSERLGMPKSATHRLLGELLSAGFVHQDAAGAAYAMTMKLPSLGVRFLGASGVQEVCQPVLERLAVASGELVRLAVAEADGLYWVARAQGAQGGLRYDPEQGTCVNLHVTAVGKAWLATLSEEAAIALATSAEGFGGGRYGPRALTSTAQLRAALTRTRRAGYGQAVDEGEPGASAIACAIRPDPASLAVGTVSIAGPTARMTSARMAELLPALRAAAAELAALWPLRRYLAGTAAGLERVA